MLRHEFRSLCSLPSSLLISKHLAKYSNQVDVGPGSTDKQEDTTITIRRQKAGQRPVLNKPDDYLIHHEAWKKQLPHEEDPSSLTYVPDPRNRYHVGPRNHGWGVSSDFVVKASRKFDFSDEGMNEWYRHENYKQEKERQKFNPMRHGILGPDLASAHFVAYRGGRVKFIGHSEWWLDKDNLPKSYEDGYIVEKIDASAIGLNCEGVTNLCNLYNLIDLNLTNNLDLDVFAFDKLYRQFRFSTCLKSLNVTNCVNFCENSLASIHQIPSLEEVIITGTKAASYKFTNLIILMLHDVNPQLKIII